MMEKIMKQKKIWIAAGASMFLVLAAVIAVFAGRKEPAYRSIRIVELSGSVSIERSGVGTLSASENMNLVSGDRVATDKEAYVVLCLDTDKYVMLGEAGAMTVVAEGDGKSGKTSINLEGGSVLNEIRNPLSEGSSYEIATPNATMSVRGTVFEVRKEDKDDGQITVLVYDGSVAVELNQKDAVLYGAGEYTVFTDEAVPAVIVERGTVSGEVLDDQVRQRLQEIQSEGRTLNVGNADLSDEELTASVPTASPEGENKENNVTATTTPAPTTTPGATATPAPTATPGATVTPAPTATPGATATPAPTVTPGATATPAPTVTPGVTATPAPTVTPGATATPAPTPVPIVTATPAPTEAPTMAEAPASEPEEDDEEPDEDDYEESAPTAAPTREPAPTAAPTREPAPTAAPTREPAPTAAPTREPAPTAAPTREPAPTAAPTREPAPTADPVQPTESPEPPKKGYCRVSYVIPYILLNGKEPENAAEAAGIKPAQSYGVGDVKKGDLIWKQKDAEVTSIPNHTETQGLGLTFVGWYQENGYVWHFNMYAIMEDTVLYPVWKDKDGNLYKVKVLKELGVCYSVNVGPESSPSPEPFGSPSPEPFGSPSPEPFGSPSPEPSGSPSPEPSGSPSPEPSGSPDPAPSDEPAGAS